ncbi:class I SAM-dependent methyltransferase [Paenibacillus sp. HWE-109]|uniref:O-methyltransferase n=1 Tax=Paenibacillus sp. HWE-109 TaxID=1306526 RepID=UPI001EDF7095|nr:class I SAM-dependent methyltransferase [Paenibacillus sp. HWE-109]UKS26612.1 class I SAM-dependent methyltransferase [Paenibacillus sp. HWE-109]
MFNDTDNIKVPSMLNKLQKDVEQSGFNLSCDYQTGTILRTLAASKKGGYFLELGTGAGVSTSWILDGMDRDSTLVTVEQEESLHTIAKKHLASDSRVSFYTGDGGKFIEDAKDKEVYDFIFADTFPGKFYLLDETLQMLKQGGLYIIDDLTQVESWGDSHKQKVVELVSHIETREDLVITKLFWSTGLIIVTKI